MQPEEVEGCNSAGDSMHGYSDDCGDSEDLEWALEGGLEEMGQSGFVSSSLRDETQCEDSKETTNAIQPVRTTSMEMAEVCVGDFINKVFAEQAPIVVATDGDDAMREAIRRVFVK